MIRAEPRRGRDITLAGNHEPRDERGIARILDVAANRFERHLVEIGVEVAAHDDWTFGSASKEAVNEHPRLEAWPRRLTAEMNEPSAQPEADCQKADSVLPRNVGRSFDFKCRFNAWRVEPSGRVMPAWRMGRSQVTSIALASGGMAVTRR